MPYQTLDARKLTTIIERLKRRIEERFPGSPWNRPTRGLATTGAGPALGAAHRPSASTRG